MANVATLADGRLDIFQEITRKSVYATLSQPERENTFDAWCIALVDRALNTKQKGDAFERLCVEYLTRVAGFPEVWLLSDLPEGVRKQLGLRRNDFGIDIICRDARGDFHAVQAKFRLPRGRARTCSLSWSDLSTFEALCARSGPYAKHWVMTSATSVRRIGARSAKDCTVALQRWRSLDRAFWLGIAQLHGQRLGDTRATATETLSSTKNSQSLPNVEALRAARLQHFAATANQTHNEQ